MKIAGSGSIRGVEFILVARSSMARSHFGKGYFRVAARSLCSVARLLDPHPKTFMANCRRAFSPSVPDSRCTARFHGTPAGAVGLIRKSPANLLFSRRQRPVDRARPAGRTRRAARNSARGGVRPCEQVKIMEDHLAATLTNAAAGTVSLRMMPVSSDVSLRR